jgi:hypothetical protein
MERGNPKRGGRRVDPEASEGLVFLSTDWWIAPLRSVANGDGVGILLRRKEAPYVHGTAPALAGEK